MNRQRLHLERLINASTIVPAVNQVELHPALQNRDVIAANTRHGIATEVWSPLAQAAVLGEPAVTTIATAHGKTPAQVVPRWHLQEGRIVIPKSVTPARIAENLDVFDFDLTVDELSVIDALDRDGRTPPSSTANDRASIPPSRPASAGDSFLMRSCAHAPKRACARRNQ
ncbi:hypothetical protein MSA03_24580 [Microbacterium saccharophilum]|uniref:aldo/keto reductase n=1 Tax=Microbacterium saccharophilum TaxID=1213358 RepID=UPI0011968204|nr:aldo/keto reductase [Microbacterium saccharophilum]GEP48950.1 hypothetical protein MSA03_24580 [Microbacterium saccharophilum]